MKRLMVKLVLVSLKYGSRCRRLEPVFCRRRASRALECWHRKKFGPLTLRRRCEDSNIEIGRPDSSQGRLRLVLSNLSGTMMIRGNVA